MEEKAGRKKIEGERDALLWLKKRASGVRILLWSSAGAGFGASLLFVLQSFFIAAFLADSSSGSGPFFLWALLPVFILRTLFLGLRDLFGAKAGLRLRKGIRRELLGKIATLGPNRTRIAEDGALSAMVLEGVDAMDDYFARYFPRKILALATPLLVIAAVAPYSLLVSLLLLLTAPLVPFFMFLVGKEAAGAGRRQMNTLAVLSAKIRELLRGLHVLRQLNATSSARKRLQDAAEDYRKRTLAVLRIAFLSSAVLELFASVAIALVAVYLGMGLLKMVPWARGETPVSLFPALFILLLVPEFYGALRRYGADYHAKAAAVAAALSLAPLLEQEPPPAKGKGKWESSSPPDILFKNLSWQPESRQTVLQKISIHVGPSERIGLIGPSGAGKSSILNLLLGFEQPSSGEILVNGEPLSAFDPDSFREKIVFLGQNVDWFSLTIAENLKLARKDATEEELYGVLRIAGMEDFVRKLPEGLHTLVGEGGRGFSGGQLHRLALARAILQDAPLWVLDEPGAHLDMETAREVRQRIGEASRGKTLLMAGHKLSGMEWLDRLVEIRNGEIGEETPVPVTDKKDADGKSLQQTGPS